MKNKRIALFAISVLIVCVSLWRFTGKNSKNFDGISDHSGYFVASESVLPGPSPQLNVKEKPHAEEDKQGKIQNGDNRLKEPAKDSYVDRHEQPNAVLPHNAEVRSDRISFSDRSNEESPAIYDDDAMEDAESGFEELAPDERRVLELKAQVNEAVLKDYDQFTEKEVNDITNRYEKGIQQIDTEEGRRILADLYQEYPESNRGGCAALNLAVYYYNDNQPERAVALVESLIESESESIYFSGAQVLPAALFLKGKLQGPDEAWETFDRLLEDFPDAIDSNGSNYAILIEELIQNE